MNSKKKNIKSAVLIKKVAEKMANISCGSASVWGVYQPKESAAVRKHRKF